MADRLRVESEQALGLLQESHRAVEEQLAQAVSRQQEKDRELESLRAEHRDVCLKLSEVTLQRQQEQAELDSLRSRVKDGTDCDQQAERQHSEEEIQEVLEEKHQNDSKCIKDNNLSVLKATGVSSYRLRHAPLAQRSAPQGGKQVDGREGRRRGMGKGRCLSG